MKKMHSMRLDNELMTELKSHCEFKGQKTWHVENAIRDYNAKLSKDKKAKKSAKG